MSYHLKKKSKFMIDWLYIAPSGHNELMGQEMCSESQITLCTEMNMFKH